MHNLYYGFRSISVTRSKIIVFDVQQIHKLLLKDGKRNIFSFVKT